jgi:hypothetical protein
MGGFGSGRPSGSGRGTVEASRSLDVNRLHREGCLRAGWAGGWQWMHDGERVAWISLRVDSDQAHLTYRVRIGDGDWEDVAETVRIVRIACRFGGSRPFFVCPGVVNGIACGRRGGEALWSRDLLPLPALLSAGLCFAARRSLRPDIAAGQQDTHATWRRAGNGVAFSCSAKGNASADLTNAFNPLY